MKTGGLLKGILMSVLLVGGTASVCAQNEALVSSEEKTLLEKLSGNKRKIDWANMNIQFASSLKASFINREFDEAAFRIDRIRLEILGAFHNKFSYHFRQSFNQYTNPNIPLDNLSGSVELAVVNWNVSDRVTLSAGKQAVQLSGYEYWVSAIKVRQFSDFNNAIPCYQAGLNVSYALNPDQTMNFQVTNLRNGALEDQFMYGLPQGVERSKVPVLATANWDGFFVDRALQLRYSLSYGQLAKKKNIFYFTCGNVWDKKPFLGYIDLMFSREGLDSKGLLSGITVDEEGNGTTIQNVNYFTTIGNLDYRVNPHLNLYIKGVYEQGGVYKETPGFEEGTYRRVWNTQLCAEYYPMENSELLLYLHFLYKNIHFTERARLLGGENRNEQRISLGLVYTLPVF